MNDNNDIKSIDGLFKPRTVAIFEAKENFSFFIEGFKTQGFNLANLYLVSPSEDEVLGIKCYKSFVDIPINTIDLLILAVGRDRLIQSLKEILAVKKVKFIHFFTARTGEADEVGVKIEDEIRDILDHEHPNTRAIGPNCMGVYCPKHSSYLPDFPIEKGIIGLIFHSGDLCSRTIRYGSMRYNLNFSKGASIGNCVNLQVSDFLEFFNQDEETEIIAIYFEGFSRYGKNEGRKLFNLLKNMRKPVLFLRGGKTQRGQSAVLSHTGSLGTSERIWQAIYNQTPLIELGSSINELIDFLFIFNKFYKNNQRLSLKDQLNLYPNGKNILVIIWSGGLGILDTDTLTEFGLNLPLFNEKTVEKLLKIYPLKVGSLSNPLDLPWISSRRHQEYLNLCKAAISEDIQLVVMYTDARRRDKKTFEIMYNNLKIIKEYVESVNKVFILILPDSPLIIRKRYYKRLLKDDFLVYPDIQRAAKAFLAFYKHGNHLRRKLKNIEP
ncbi:MAG: CoA-binding protein [Promethearchaeota archaeon]